MNVAVAKTFELVEWESRVVDATIGSTDSKLIQELASGEEGRLLVEELKAGVRITARSWVGVVRFENFEVRITPKLAGDNIGLVEMIEFTTGILALRRNSSARTLHTDDAGLLDLLALLLAEACEGILRGGLLADYVEREDDLPVIRGRLLGDQQILRRFGQIDRLICRYDEHEQNILENQLLAAALGVCAVRVRHDSVRQRVRRLLAIFHEICNPDELNLDAARSQMIYHRMNEHYRHAHELAWLLLDGLGTRDLLTSGKTLCFAFLIDMNRLFEMFVYRLVDRLLLGKQVRVRYQYGDRSIIVNALTNQGYSRVIPDVVVESGNADATVRIAVDAKYKLYDEKKLGSGDIYQSFLYAYAYGTSRDHTLPTAVIVYPASTRTTQSLKLRVQGKQGLFAAEILALGISIPEALAEVRRVDHGPVTRALVDAINQGLDRSQLTAA